MATSIQLNVEYIDMSPTQYALWRKQVAELYAYVESIALDESDFIADSRIGVLCNQPVSSSAD